ncbi:hypothetical protein Q7P37_001142 [Cladosporium fusiforme]
MRFSFALFVAICGVAVEARPASTPETHVTYADFVRQNNPDIIARGLLDSFRNNRKSPTGDSRSNTTTTKTQHGDDVITTTDSAGTTNDRTGFRWEAASNATTSG